jgi:hypothetical protein
MFPGEYCIPPHQHMTRYQGADEEDGLQTPIATIKLNKH